MRTGQGLPEEWRIDLYLPGASLPQAGAELEVVNDFNSARTGSGASYVSVLGGGSDIMPIPRDWITTSGRIRINSSSTTRVDGSFTLDAHLGGSSPALGPVRITGSFTAICQAYPGCD